MRSFARLVTIPLFGLLAAASVRANPSLEMAQLTFQRNCAACHSLEKGRHLTGPSLHGVYGRHAGKAEGYAYSDALRGMNVVWSDSSLDAYLADSQKAAPGNKMWVRLTDANARNALVMLLKATPGDGR